MTTHNGPAMVPEALDALINRSAAPQAVALVVRRLTEERPTAADRLAGPESLQPLAGAVVAVAAASNSLGRLCVADAAALDVLDNLDRPVPIDATDPISLARTKHLELLRIAARDLLDIDGMDAVGAALATMAERVLAGAVDLSAPSRPIAVIGMGKLGGQELNFASDVDVVFVTEGGPDEDAARRVLRIAGQSFRVDADLRPEGRAGPLTRTLDGYGAYWDRWASTWEFQALIKARAVAGDAELGARFSLAAAERVWERTFSADELAEVRAMKQRTEAYIAGRGLAGREIKRGAGGIRDVEFAVQLLQLVHGRHDPEIRQRTTTRALFELADAGYVAAEDAEALTGAYRFLRTVEHRLQLVEEEQTHAVPTDDAARHRLARVTGFEDDAATSATAKFDDALRLCQREVRAIHERLFFRPLLEAFATVGQDWAADRLRPPSDGSFAAPIMSADAVARRLSAFGFADARRTRAAVEELAGGLTRSSRLMAQLLPLLLDWLSLTPDPDLGLLGLRNLVVRAHQRSLMVAAFRESPEAARRLCLLLGTSRMLGEAIEHNPELVTALGDDDALAPTSRASLVAETGERLQRNDDEGWRRAQLVRIRQDQHLRIAARDLLQLDDVVETGQALSAVGEAVLESALAIARPPMPVTVVGMGRLGGSEMAYASDLDVLLVCEEEGAESEAVGETLLRVMHGPSPSQRVMPVDLSLRPEGAQGRLVRDLHGYAIYFERWAHTWERQALLRARVVAGDRDLGERFMALARTFVWGTNMGEPEIAAIRRLKARMERERIPVHEDPQFHLKLGRGSLSDVEWTVQLLQLVHGVEGTSTVATLETLGDRRILSPDDVAALRDSYRFCERTRNRWHLVGALPGGTPPGDSLPTQAHQLSRLARSLATTPSALRDEYRRVTRRARRVVERTFYGITGDGMAG